MCGHKQPICLTSLGRTFIKSTRSVTPKGDCLDLLLRGSMNSSLFSMYGLLRRVPVGWDLAACRRPLRQRRTETPQWNTHRKQINPFTAVYYFCFCIFDTLFSTQTDKTFWNYFGYCGNQQSYYTKYEAIFHVKMPLSHYVRSCFPYQHSPIYPS